METIIKIMKNALDGKVDVDDLRDRKPHERKKNALDRLAHPTIFHRRLAHNGGRVDGILAMRDATEMENRIKVLERVEAGMISEMGLRFLVLRGLRGLPG